MTYGWRDIEGVRVELCDECGFDARDEIDLRPRLAAGYAALKRFTGAADAGRRPGANTWSGVEYGKHMVGVTTEILRVCDEALGRPEQDHVLPDVAMAAVAADTYAATLGKDDWRTPVPAWPFAMTVAATFVHLLHDLEHHVLDVRRGLAKLGLERGEEVHTSRP